MQADSSIVIIFGARNTSNRAWPANGRIKAGCYWTDEQGRRIRAPEGRGHTPNEVPPGSIQEYRIRVRAPATPGTYVLVLDMVEEHLAWFGSRGATPVRVTVTVE